MYGNYVWIHLGSQKKNLHLPPKKPQYSPHKHRPIDYGANQQIVQPADTSPSLYDKCIRRVRGIVIAILYVGIPVENRLLVALSTIGAHQAAATEETADVIEQLLDYVGTYPYNGIIFRKSDMISAEHIVAGFLNKSRVCSRSGAHIFLSENNPKPRLNAPVLTIAQIIKALMDSADEAEMASLYITYKNMIPIRKTINEMGWPQPKLPIQKYKSTDVVFTNKIIVNKATRSADMKSWWLRDRESQ